jgi:hypothetical protein
MYIYIYICKDMCTCLYAYLYLDYIAGGGGTLMMRFVTLYINLYSDDVFIYLYICVFEFIYAYICIYIYV